MSVLNTTDIRLPRDEVTRSCRFGWCTLTHPGHGEHEASHYIPATGFGHYCPGLKIGAGVMVVDDGSPASIFVHIDEDSDREYAQDADAYMTVDEATDLVDALVAAIAHARTTESVAQ